MKSKRYAITLMLALAALIPAEGFGHGGGGHFGGGRFGGGYFGGGGHYGGYYRGGGIHYGYGYYPRSSFGIYFGPSWYYPWYYGYPYYYNPPVVVPSSPPTYIEKDEPDYSWNYCTNPQGYYPYVKECRGSWESVTPQPPGQEPNYWYYCDESRGYYPYVRECPNGWRTLPPQAEPIK